MRVSLPVGLLSYRTKWVSAPSPREHKKSIAEDLGYKRQLPASLKQRRTIMKDKFLKITKVLNEKDAMKNSIIASLQRNRTYKEGTSDTDKRELRKALEDQIRSFAEKYLKPVSDEDHIGNICHICSQIKKQHASILFDSKLRLGTAQKAFNLYLKFLWCLDIKRATPPHCPIDGIILKKAGINGSWTKLDSKDIYLRWIDQIRSVTQKNGFDSIPQWELAIWNSSLV